MKSILRKVRDILGSDVTAMLMLAGLVVLSFTAWGWSDISGFKRGLIAGVSIVLLANMLFERFVLKQHLIRTGVRNLLAREHSYQEVLSDITFYVDWHFITRKLTTEQKDLWADAIDIHQRRMEQEEIARGFEPIPGEYAPIERWWRE